MKHNNKNVKNQNMPSIVMVGGGFAGVRATLDLARKIGNESHITLVTKEPYLTYYPAMYRFVTGTTPRQVAIPLETIFKKYPQVSVRVEEVVTIDAVTKMITTDQGNSMTADYLIVAVGSENNYFHIEGVDEISYDFKSFQAAEILRARIQKLFTQHKEADIEEILLALHFVIVGGGPSGVELAGELVVYARQLARYHQVPESLVTIDIVERGERLVSRMPEKASRKIEQRLKALGVHVFLNRTLVRNESWTVFLQDMKLGAKTVVWTAGVRSASLSQNIPGLAYTERGKIEVTEHFESHSGSQVFVLGDIADAPHSGLAQGAIAHGEHAARVIISDIQGTRRPKPRASEPWHVVPVGPLWGALQYRNFLLFGILAWGARFFADARYYLSILPFSEVIRILFTKKKTPETDSLTKHSKDH